MNKKFILASILLTLALTGCGTTAKSVPTSPSATEPATSASTTEAASTTAAAETTEAAVKTKTIGKEKSGENVYIAEITNKTGKDITGFCVKTDSETAFPGSMLDKEDPFLKDEKRVLYYERPDVSGNTSLPEDNKPVISTAYTIKLTFSDNTTAELHQFPFDTMDKAEINFEDNIVFITYESKVTGEKVSTKDAEDMISDNTGDSSAETPVSAGDSSQQAAPDNNDNSYISGNNTYEEPAYDPTPEPVYTNAPDPEPVYVPEPATEAPVQVTPDPEPVQQQTEAPVAEDPDPNGGCLQGGGLFW